MCGIAGLVQLAAEAPPPDAAATVSRMLGRLAHRGPDGEGNAAAGPAQLGHRRLAIIDLEGGAQPIASPSGQVELVFNGEIYNYRELRGALEPLGHRFRTSSDSEVLAAAIEEWSVDCLPRLRGMFAFGAWDQRRRQLLLVRDRLGKKPLYWARRGPLLGFASELPALLAWPAITPTLDGTAIAGYLRDGYIAAPRSAIEGVRKLRPGSYLIAAHGADAKIVEHTYWDLRFQDKLHDRGAARRRLRELLEAAVADRLVADVPVGAFLSSGLDSSLVVSTAAALVRGPIDTFTVGFDRAPTLDERDGARLLATRLGTRHHEAAVQLEAAEALPAIVARLGEPLGDPSALPTFEVARLAHARVKVVLTGDGGDETFAGYARYSRSQLSFAFARVPPPLRRAISAAMRVAGVSSERVQEMEKRAATAPHALYAESMNVFTPDNALGILHADHRASGAAAIDEYPLMRLYDEAPAEEWLDRLLYTDLKSYLSENVLVKVDRMTMAHGIEARSPLLDHRLVELSAQLPPSWKRSGVHGKLLLREVAAEVLPREVLDAPKRGFDLPLGSWMRSGALRTKLEEDLGQSTLVRDGWLDGAAVAAQLAPGDDGQAALGNRLWSLYVLELWYRQLHQHA